jgi:response regulator RpfG family c-di-GMP phosphodiesterase
MRKRILFVDDDPTLVRAYTLVLQSQSARWEVRSATSAAAALELANREAFDIVVADMRMPGMSGVELIAEIRKRHPQTSRVVLSGVRDQEEVARCLGDTHQFIAKPVDLETLRATIERLCQLDAYLSDANVRALVGQFGVLPSFPALYFEVVNELAAPDASIERVAEIVSQDPAMTAKMLQIVNSAMFGLARKVTNPIEVVQFLGTATVRSLVLSVHVFSSFDRPPHGFSIEEFWRHALQTAGLARVICRSVGADETVTEDAYLAGMLHDVGKLMLASSRPEQFMQAERLAAERRFAGHHRRSGCVPSQPEQK